MNRLLLPLVGLALLGCASSQGRGVAPRPPHECGCAHKDGKVPTADAKSPASAGPAPDHGKAAVPVTDADPTWGSPDAPVTIVEWSDFECPFCSRVGETLAELQRSYGPQQLRLVWKNLPLPFHADSRPAAAAAMTVHALGGNGAFWKFHDLAFLNQQHLSPENYAVWAAQAGVDQARFETAAAARGAQEKLDDDVALATRLDIRGTPVFRINGVPLVGAQPIESFRAIIEGQLAAAKDLLAAGTTPRGIYPALCNRNIVAAAPLPAVAAQARPEDTRIYGVPVEKDDPVRGPADAPVTLVVFSDFECPFCQRLETTLTALMRKYGDELRIVWKDYPLPFHRQAIPAAVLARLAFAQKGDHGFWQAHDAILESGQVLDEPALKAVAGRLGLSWSEVGKAVADHRFQAIFDRGHELVGKLQVRGTPCTFVNGRRIDGAMPVEAFVSVIDAQLAKARDMLEAGSERASLYAALTNTPIPQEELERKTVDAPTRDNPGKGGARAKVTVQVFGDFQCPHCLRLMPTLAELEKKFSGRVRLVWRNHPLVFHEDAALAAEAAQEVFAQKGAAAFWRYHGLLFAAQTEGGLGREMLEKLARKLGVDGKRLRAALDSRRHRDAIERDVAAARKAEIVEVPAVLVNGYLVSGVEPMEVYERAVTRALAEAGHGP
jgi:protein-disulfide isomerase